jgi:ribosomal protein S13
MKRVDRAELLGIGAYEQVRERFRDRVIALKARRRVQLGANMSLVFENHDTVLLQIQEMLRTERISDERAIAHELETYNDLIPVEGALSATLFIEYDDAVERRRMLASFASLREQIELSIAGQKTTARFSTHYGEELDRLPAVNYLMFQPGTAAAATLRDRAQRVTLAISHPDYRATCELPDALREELAHDLEA